MKFDWFSKLFQRTIIQQPQGLISVLTDKNAEWADRDDAAMELGAYDDIEAEQVLIETVINQNEDEGIADSAGESLKEIWIRKKKWDSVLIKNMHPAAKKFFLEKK